MSIKKGSFKKCSAMDENNMECYEIQHDGKILYGFGSQVVTGVIAFVTGIVTMVRVTRNMPKKLTDSNFYSNPTYYDDLVFNRNTNQIAPPATDMSVIKRIVELEERMKDLNAKPPTMPIEKEELLNSALNKVESLEQELMATKKVPIIACILKSVLNFLY